MHLQGVRTHGSSILRCSWCSVMLMVRYSCSQLCEGCVSEQMGEQVCQDVCRRTRDGIGARTHRGPTHQNLVAVGTHLLACTPVRSFSRPARLPLPLYLTPSTSRCLSPPRTPSRRVARRCVLEMLLWVRLTLGAMVITRHAERMKTSTRGRLGAPWVSRPDLCVGRMASTCRARI